MGGKNHHVVSRGYLRFFADGKRASYIDRRDRSFKRYVGIRDMFVETRFNSFRSLEGWDDSAESRWEDYENIDLPLIHKMFNGNREPEGYGAARRLAAVHFARSFAVREIQKQIAVLVPIGVSRKMATDGKATRAYLDHFGHAPGPGEMERYIDQQMNLLVKSRRIHVDGMIRTFNAAMKLFGDAHLQLLRVEGPVELLTGDIPVVPCDANCFRLGVRDGLVLARAPMTYMPLGRRLGMKLWTEGQPPDGVLTRVEVQTLNWLMWRAADRFLVCHPSASPSRLLATGLTEATTLAPLGVDLEAPRAAS
jgi:hypothetical protein